jgi:tetratricopeptide (TPR) repeat protein
MTAATRFFFGLAMLGLCGPAAQAAPAADAVIAEAGAALDGGDAAQAQRLADSGLAETGLSTLQRGRLWLDRGLARELQGSSQDAMVDFTAAIETHALPPDERAQALLQRGFLLDGLNRLDDAAKDYSAAIALKTPALSTALNNRANVYRRQGRMEEARRDYQAALGAGTARAQFPYYGLGQIAEARQDKDAARQFYAKAVAADPGYRLASERLAALGGPPQATLAEPDVITLHPPAPHPPEQTAAPSAAAIILHPPPSARRLAPRRAQPGQGATQAAGPGLRPALDGPAADGGPEVQLGAWRSEPEAQAGWDRAKQTAGKALDGHAAHVVRAEIPGKGIYFRLRVDAANPAGLCASLRVARLDCVPVRP